MFHQLKYIIHTVALIIFHMFFFLLHVDHIMKIKHILLESLEI